MIKIQELPIILLMSFTLVYGCIGDPDSRLWSGAFFIVNYLTMLMLCKNHKSKIVRLIGISLNVTLLTYTIFKYIFDIDVFRLANLLTFAICLVGLFLIEIRNKR